MLFNSIEFLIFLPLVFAGYWLLHRHLKLQNLFVVTVSYVFYGWWDWRFLILIAFTSLWAFVFGLFELGGAPRSLASKSRLALSCAINLGILGYFKYCDFFVAQAAVLLRHFGFEPHVSSLKIILPVGISFYTFQALSYTIDVYRRTIVPTKDPIAFFAFISFFPQLVAGPIERATKLLPQFLKARRFDYPLAVEGCRQMLWGFFKKVLVADTCAQVANSMLGGLAPSSFSIIVGVVCFAFQIYGDFSGYSDIAIGCAKLFGIRLMRNFAYPYFARDIAEFWRRWHISLTTWFRDYLYIPLGGSRCGSFKRLRNTFVIFLVSGLWHGANWTFIIWGAFHAVCFIPLLLAGKNRRYVSDNVAMGKVFPSLVELLQMMATFAIVVFGWSLFRAPDLATWWDWFDLSFLHPDLRIGGMKFNSLAVAFIPVMALIAVDWFNRGREIPSLPRSRALRWLLYSVTILFCISKERVSSGFIYFQF